MPRGVRAGKKAPAVNPIEQRIREAEKQYVPVDRVPVPISAASLDNLVALIEGGAGTKAEVLRTALETGLRGMMIARGQPDDEEPAPRDERVEDVDPPDEAELPLALPPVLRAVPEPPAAAAPRSAFGLAATAVGGGPMSALRAHAPITEPPPARYLEETGV